MNDRGCRYRDPHAESYHRSMELLGRPLPRIVEAAPARRAPRRGQDAIVRDWA